MPQYTFVTIEQRDTRDGCKAYMDWEGMTDTDKLLAKVRKQIPCFDDMAEQEQTLMLHYLHARADSMGLRDITPSVIGTAYDYVMWLTSECNGVALNSWKA